MRTIPSKNYVYLAIIVVATVLITIALSKFYNNRHLKTSILYNYLSEVTLEDLDTYLTEHDTAILYIGDKYSSETKKENKFKEKIIKYDLNGQIVFMDSNRINDQFVNSFNQKYHYQFKEDYPTVMIINQDGVIKTYYSEDIDDINFEELK